MSKETIEELRKWTKLQLKDISNNFEEALKNVAKESWNAALKKAKEEILNHDFKKGIDYNWLENIRKPICKIIEGLRK